MADEGEAADSAEPVEGAVEEAVAEAAAAAAAAAAAPLRPLVLAWTLACRFFSSDLANLRPQISHVKGFSPV